MNLFRSEEHARNWVDFDPEAEEALMPVRDWAAAMTTSVSRSRLAPDTLVRQQEYGARLLENLAELGRDGLRWRSQD